jgi:hypothetical protein
VLPRLDPRFCFTRLEVGPSPIHRWGVFAAVPIPARRRVIEYTGQLIDNREARRRGVRQYLYLFRLDPHRVIDGAFGGSGAEFVNHSCDPNLVARLVRGRIVLTSLRGIAAGEELTLDYKLDTDGAEMRCSCGSEKCRGVVNVTRAVATPPPPAPAIATALGRFPGRCLARRLRRRGECRTRHPHPGTALASASRRSD